MTVNSSVDATQMFVLEHKNLFVNMLASLAISICILSALEFTAVLDTLLIYWQKLNAELKLPHANLCPRMLSSCTLKNFPLRYRLLPLHKCDWKESNFPV